MRLRFENVVKDLKRLGEHGLAKEVEARMEIRLNTESVSS